MVKEITFQLDTQAASVILTDMAAPLVRKSADAIAGRAGAMVTSITSEPVSVIVSSEVGTVPRGRGKRSIATVRASGLNARHDKLLLALVKAKDAGRV